MEKSSRNENSRITIEVFGVHLVNLVNVFGAQVSECSQGSQTIILKIIVSPQIHKTAQQM